MRNRIEKYNSKGDDGDDWKENKLLMVTMIGWSTLIVGYLSKIGYGYVLSRWNTEVEGENNDEGEIGVNSEGGE